MAKTYEQQLGEKLESARSRVRMSNQMKALKDNAPALFEVIDTEVYSIYTKAFGDKPLSYDDYLSAHGEMRALKRIRNLVDSKEVDGVMAQQEAQAIQKNLKQIQDDKKQQ
jgi:hypothetical protein